MKNGRGQIEIAVIKLKLPWSNWSCRDQIEIAVALLGHGRVVSGSHRTEGKTKERLYSFI